MFDCQRVLTAGNHAPPKKWLIWGWAYYHIIIVSGWWLNPSPLKTMKVSWDYYSQLNGKIKVMFQTTNQLFLASFRSPLERLWGWAFQRGCGGVAFGAHVVTPQLGEGSLVRTMATIDTLW